MSSLHALKRRPRGFTLVEILVIAAILSILAGIGIISANTFITRARLRAVIGETHNIATSLQLARDDISFYPKLCFLVHGANAIGENGLGQLDPSSNRLNPSFDLYGLDVQDQTTRVRANWNGPYMGMSPSRARLGRGNPGVVQMELPETGERMDWPGDAWQQPYCVYQISLNSEGVPVWHTNLNAISPDPDLQVNFWGTAPDFMNAVVSYGPNQVPGGELPSDETRAIVGGTFDTIDSRKAVRLYETIDERNLIYRSLEGSDYADLTTPAIQRLSMIYSIRDPESDDLVREF